MPHVTHNMRNENQSYNKTPFLTNHRSQNSKPNTLPDYEEIGILMCCQQEDKWYNPYGAKFGNILQKNMYSLVQQPHFQDFTLNIYHYNYMVYAPVIHCNIICNKMEEKEPKCPAITNRLKTKSPYRYNRALCRHKEIRRISMSGYEMVFRNKQ